MQIYTCLVIFLGLMSTPDSLTEQDYPVGGYPEQP